MVPSPPKIDCFHLFIIAIVFLYAFPTPSNSEASPLQDVALHCCTGIAEPYVMENKRRLPHPFEGIAIDYLTHLTHRTGLTCKTLSEPNVDGVGWDSIITGMQACQKNGTRCECDIGMGPWYELDKRSDLDFLPAFSDGEWVVVVHVDNTFKSSGNAFFLTVFKPMVWVSISGLLIIFTILKMLDRRFAPVPEEFRPLPRSEGWYKIFKHFVLKGKILFRLRKAVQSTLSLSIGDSSTRIPGDSSSTRQWFLNFTIVLCGLFFVLTYEAVLAALLVQEKTISNYRTFQDFISCKIPPQDVCFPKGDAMEHIWKNATKNIPCHSGRKPNTNYTSYETAMEAVANKKCKYWIADGGVALGAIHGQYCKNLISTGESFFKNGVHIVLPQNSTYFEPIRKATLHLREEGTIDTLHQYFERKRKPCELEASPSLTFRKLRVFFLVSFVVCGLLFIEMILDPQAPAKPICGKPKSPAMAYEGENKEDSQSGSDSLKSVPSL